MTGAEYDGAVRALQVRAEALIEETRRRLAVDAEAVVGALEGRAEVLERHARTSDLVASSAFFSAVPMTLRESDRPDAVVFSQERWQVGLVQNHGGWMTDAPAFCPPGAYVLVVALIPRALPEKA